MNPALEPSFFDKVIEWILAQWSVLDYVVTIKNKLNMNIPSNLSFVDRAVLWFLSNLSLLDYMILFVLVLLIIWFIRSWYWQSDEQIKLLKDILDELKRKPSLE